MANNLEAIQNAVIAEIQSMPQKTYEQAVPDAASLKRTPAGAVDVYITYQFGDIQASGVTSFAGPRADDYQMPLYVQVIAPTPQTARQVYNRLMDKLLGSTFPYTGNIRKRAGGGMWPITGSTNAVECYVFPASFGLLIQFD